MIFPIQIKEMSKEEKKAQKVGALLNPRIINPKQEKNQEMLPYSNQEITKEPKTKRGRNLLQELLFHAKL